MESNNQNICSICSEAVCSSEKIALDEDFLRLLKVLFAKIDCSALQNTRACENCLSVIQDACNFKMMCVEQRALNVAIETDQTEAKLQLLEIPCICQICKKIIKKSGSVAFTEELKFVINHLIEEMETGLEATEDPHICISCRESVMNLHPVIKLLSNLTKNNDHKSNAKICIEQSNNTNKIKTNEELLMDYLNVTNDSAIIKNESVEAENIKNYGEIDMPIKNKVNRTYEDFIMKNEEVDIKTECERDASTKQIWKSIENVKVNLSNKIKVFACDDCDYKSQKKSCIKRHVLKHKSTDEIEMFACDVCDYKAKLKSYLKKHMLKHKSVDEVDVFTCDICGYKTKYKKSLKDHLLKKAHKSIVETEVFTCDTCDFQTTCKLSFKDHLEKAHENTVETEVFTCDTCGFKTTCKLSLKNHFIQKEHKSVVETKLFTCDICNYKTNYKSSLIIHMSLHKNIDEIQMLKRKNVDEVKIFTCDICNYKEKSVSLFKTHLKKVHENVGETKLFTCDICNYKTRYNSSLIIHMSVHKCVDEIQMFTCNVCDYKVKQKTSLNKHMLKHKNVDEVKRFACDICSFKTNHKIILENHLNEVHKTEQLTCDVCDYTTNCNSSFKIHMSLHENMDEMCVQCW